MGMLRLKGKKTTLPPAIPQTEKPPFAPDTAAALPENSTLQALGRNRRILVVDDNPVVLKAFELKLKANGFAVTTVTNAAGVASAADTAKAQLIILDVNFPSGAGPDWSGFTVMQWLRRFPELAAIPIILISGEDAATHKEKAMAEGAVAFFQKPVNYQELLATILRALDGGK